MKDANTENSTGRLFVDYEHLKKCSLNGQPKSWLSQTSNRSFRLYCQ